VNIAGATGITYNITKAGNYSVVVTVPGGCSGQSAVVSASVVPVPVATVTNQDATNDLCLDASIKLKASGGAGTSWQWYKGANPLAGQTNMIYFATTPGNYKVMVTSTATGCSKISAPFAIVKTCKESDIAVDETEFMLYPNPAANQFNITLNVNSNEGSAIVQIFNLTGDEIYNAEIAVSDGIINETIDLNNKFSDGIYLVRLTIGAKEFTRQLVIQK
jgi:hypothetical protein